MGENNLKPIMGRSPILEERRAREEQLKRKRRRAQNARRRKKQRQKRVATLAAFLCIIAFGIGAITYLVKDMGKIADKGTAKQPPAADGGNISKEVDLPGMALTQADYKYECSDTDILERIAAKAENDRTMEFIYENYKAYPEYVLKAVSNNSELVNFAVKYPVEMKKTHEKVISVEGLYTPGEMPLFIQWDDRWGYYAYGEDIMGISGCGPTCLSMVIVALTGKNQYTPTAIADFAMTNGYYYDGAGTAWDLFNKGVERLGLKCHTVGKSEASMKAALDSGEYLILSMAPGIFTSVGHYIVIYDYHEDGAFLVKDPNSLIRSKTAYSYAQFEDQIKNIWLI